MVGGMLVGREGPRGTNDELVACRVGYLGEANEKKSQEGEARSRIEIGRNGESRLLICKDAPKRAGQISDKSAPTKPHQGPVAPVF